MIPPALLRLCCSITHIGCPLPAAAGWNDFGFTRGLVRTRAPPSGCHRRSAAALNLRAALHSLLISSQFIGAACDAARARGRVHRAACQDAGDR